MKLSFSRQLECTFIYINCESYILESVSVFLFTHKYTHTQIPKVSVHREASMSHLVYLLNVFYVRSPLAELEEIPSPQILCTHSFPRLWRRIYGLSDELPPKKYIPNSCFFTQKFKMN